MNKSLNTHPWTFVDSVHASVHAACPREKTQLPHKKNRPFGRFGRLHGRMAPVKALAATAPILADSVHGLSNRNRHPHFVGEK